MQQCINSCELTALLYSMYPDKSPKKGASIINTYCRLLIKVLHRLLHWRAFRSSKKIASTILGCCLCGCTNAFLELQMTFQLPSLTLPRIRLAYTAVFFCLPWYSPCSLSLHFNAPNLIHLLLHSTRILGQTLLQRIQLLTSLHEKNKEPRLEMCTLLRTHAWIEHIVRCTVTDSNIFVAGMDLDI